MAVFRGKHLLTLDEKGRFSVPKGYRERLAREETSGLVATIDPYEPCLAVYPLSEWRRVEERLCRHPGRQPDASDEEKVQADWIFRQVIGNADDCAPDSHGRLLIASGLREHVGLVVKEKRKQDAREQSRQQVRVIGQLEKFELWNEATWSDRSRQQFERNRAIADRLIAGGPAEPAEA